MGQSSGKLPKILHCVGSFGDGPTAQRIAFIINKLGMDVQHAIVVGDREQKSAAAKISRKIKVGWPSFPALSGARFPRRLMKLAAAMEGYDLICTYGRAALDVTCAHTLFADVYKLPPLVHHEDGSKEAGSARRRGNFYVRVALGRTAALVVTTAGLERTALDTWQQPRSRVRLVPDGVDVAAFAKRPARDVLPGLVKRRNERWIGAITDPLDDTADRASSLLLLVRACRDLPEEWQLVISSDEATEAAVLAEAERWGTDARVHLLGANAPRALLIGLLDIFVVPEADEGSVAPSLLEAMAAGAPVVAPNKGESGAVLSSNNGPFLVPPGDEAQMAAALGTLARDSALRKKVGEANLAKARDEHDVAQMVARMGAIYRGLMGNT